MNNSQFDRASFEQLESDDIDLKRYLSLFISNWYWFAVAIIITIGIAYGLNRWSQKIYTVSSTMLIKDDRFAGSDLSNIFPGNNSFRNQQNLSNEIGILKSYNLNLRVIQELPEFQVTYFGVGKRGIAETRLYDKCPFKVLYSSLENQIIGKKVEIKIISPDKYRISVDGNNEFSKEMNFGERFNEMGFDFSLVMRNQTQTFDPESSNKYYFLFNSTISLANQYRNKLVIVPVVEDASLVLLSTSGFVPQQEADYLNKLMSVYIDFGLEVKNKNAGQTIEFIDYQLKQISDSLHVAENDLENFRLTHKIIDISKEGLLIQDKLSQIDIENNSLEMQQDYYKYLKNYIDSKSENGDIVAPSIMGVTDGLLINMVEEISRLQKQKKQLAMNLDSSSEPIKVIENNIARNRSEISENINSGIVTIESKRASIAQRLNDVEEAIGTLPSTERQMINIQRRFDINNTVYTFLLEKRAEAGIAKASNVADNRIVDYAEAYNSSMIRPKKKNNISLALLIGLFLPAVAIVVLDLFNNKIIDKKDITRASNVPILGSISHNNFKTEIPVTEKPSSTLSESFRSVRTNLKYFIKDQNDPVISISSTISSEGKTFISVNLGAIIASGGKKVLLIGLDLRKPRLNRIFGMENERGMSTYLIGEDEFKNVIVKTGIENLWFVPSGPIPPNPAELIDSARMKDFITKAKNEFDYVIIDTPPVAIVTDALLISALSDFYIFVVRQRYTSKNTLDLINELHKNENISKLGIIINDINLSGYYGYGLRYGNMAGYGYNYGYNYYGQNKKYGYSTNSGNYFNEEK